MIRYVIVGLASLATFAVSVAHAAVDIIDSFIAFAVAAISDKQPRELPFAGPTLAFDAPGAPIDASLLQGLRHEAHVRRRSADRNV
jgi:hypothetical protein